jgi:ABC-2 type transport system ATP-binding protein
MLLIDELEKTYDPPATLLRPLVRTASRFSVVALRGVTFSVSPGEIVGLIGPNGAGKTTLIKIVATLVSPTSGRVLVDGHDVVKDAAEVRQRIGLALTDERGLYWRLTARQNLEFFAGVSGFSRSEARKRADELLVAVGLTEPDKLVFGLSSGMRTRLNLARALIWDPPLVVLDEPTRSLDPLAAANVGTLLTATAADGRAVLLSSHRLEEVASLCARVVVLVAGTVRYIGSPHIDSQADGPSSGLAALLAREMDT